MPCCVYDERRILRRTVCTIKDLPILLNYYAVLCVRKRPVLCCLRVQEVHCAVLCVRQKTRTCIIELLCRAVCTTKDLCY